MKSFRFLLLVNWVVLSVSVAEPQTSMESDEGSGYFSLSEYLNSHPGIAPEFPIDANPGEADFVTLTYSKYWEKHYSKNCTEWSGFAAQQNCDNASKGIYNPPMHFKLVNCNIENTRKVHSIMDSCYLDRNAEWGQIISNYNQYLKFGYTEDKVEYNIPEAHKCGFKLIPLDSSLSTGVKNANFTIKCRKKCKPGFQPPSGEQVDFFWCVSKDRGNF